jgi:ABC-type polysaccharide/polyol phosphate export permease
MTADHPPSRSRDWTGYEPLDASFSRRFAAALGDVSNGLAAHRSWRFLALERVKNQYRRTVLGPWWLTLQTGIYVFGLALIFGQLLSAPLRSFLPYVAIGYIVYVLLLGLTQSGAMVFVASSDVMKSTRQPLTSLVLRDVAVQFVQFAHNSVILVLFLVTGLVPLTWRLALLVPLLLVVAVNGLLIALWLGPVVARFRDIGPLVTSLLQVLIFFTPVFYRPENLRGQQALLNANPFTFLVDGVRSAAIGTPLETGTLYGLVVLTAVNTALGLLVFASTRSRLPYWVS